MKRCSRLPNGVILHELTKHRDNRGELFELFREDWVPCDAFKQWNVVRSEADVVRGIHVHPRHSDYLYVLQGSMTVYLHDLRPEDEQERISCTVTLSADRPEAIFIPPGVCHGFYFPEVAHYIYGLSTGWNPSEELGCMYNTPEFGFDWPTENPLLSPRDQSPLHSYETMRQAWISAQQDQLSC